MNQPKPDYRFYATLIDAFVYYLSSDSDNALQEFIDKLNRVPFTSEAAAKGTAFNNLVDKITLAECEALSKISCDGFEFKTSIVKEFVERLEGCSSQYRTRGYLSTNKGLVELYGYIDKIKADTATDIKTTGNYTFPKYLYNFQHIIYPFCLRQEGIDAPRFKYMITDFSNFYEEDYVFNPDSDLPRLTNICERLIDFIESNRHLITDKKLFAEDVYLVG